jgi:flagellar hook-length control protein FliK
MQDAFREVFQSRLQARLNSRESASRAAAAPSRVGNSRTLGSRGGLGAGSSAAAGSSPGESRPLAAARGKNTQGLERRTKARPESPTSVATPAADQSQAGSQAKPNQTGSTAAGPPQALRDFMAFLESQPGGSLKIPREQAPAVAAFLASAGLPQAEVDRLLSASGSQELTLTAADLNAAWQQAQGQGQSAAGGAAAGLNQTQAASNQAQAGANQNQEAQDILQSQDYRALWERLSLPQSLLPTLRLALARLGGSPQVLAQLEEEGQGGRGIPLTRVWQILQNVKDGQGLNETANQSGTASGANPSPAALSGQQPVTGAEMEEWRQMLLQAGLPGEVVEKLLGRVSPGNQEQLKTTLLALAPAEDSPAGVTDPKPLYLPANLRMRPFFWQSQSNGDQPQAEGNSAGEKGNSAAAQFIALTPPSSPGETLALPTFAAQIQGLTQGLGEAGAPLGDAAPVWRPLTPEVQESLWTQLRSGVASNLSQGDSQVTISLNPPELGQIQLSLHLSGQELAVTAVATRPEVAALANLGVPQLLQALAQQGMVLTQFQVRVQDQPAGQIPPVAAGARQKGSEPGGNLSTSSRRRSGEVDRFV